MKKYTMHCWVCSRIVKDIMGVYVVIPFIKGQISLTQPLCKKCKESIKFWVQCRSNRK